MEWADSGESGWARQVSRIEAMEAALDEVKAANNALDAALRRFSQAQDRAADLNRYLGSDEWIAAREADAAGQLPADLKRGVLSEDAAYDALADNRASAIAMMEIAIDVLR